MQILCLLGMYFDAVVVEVKSFLLLFRLALAILWVDTQWRHELKKSEILGQRRGRQNILRNLGVEVDFGPCSKGNFLTDSDGILAIEIQYHSIAYRKIEAESADGFCLLFSNSHVSMLLNSQILQVKCPEVKWDCGHRRRNQRLLREFSWRIEGANVFLGSWNYTGCCISPYSFVPIDIYSVHYLAHDSSNRISSRAKCTSIFKFEDI